MAELRAQVLASSQRLVADGLSHGSAGNISAMDRSSDLIAITPSAIEYAHMQPADVVVIDPDGQVVEGKWKPTSEIHLHTIFYRERPDVGAVIHSHAPYATVFAIANEPLPMVLAETAPFLGGPVKVAPYARTGTRELADCVLETIGQGVAILLANHGLLTVGPDLDKAYRASLSAELTARFVYMARAMGARPVALDPVEVAALREIILRDYHPTPAKKKNTQ